MLKQWKDLPAFRRLDEVRPYWDGYRNRGQLVLKRVFDRIVSLILLIILAIPMAMIVLLFKKEEPGLSLF